MGYTHILSTGSSILNAICLIIKEKKLVPLFVLVKITPGWALIYALGNFEFTCGSPNIIKLRNFLLPA
jgi:hypothetical protein